MTMREKIVAAFKSIGSGTYSDALSHLQMKQKDSKKVLRRISELVKAELLIKIDDRDTSKGRTSAVYTLGINMPKTNKEERRQEKKKKVKKVNPESIITKYIQPELYL